MADGPEPADSTSAAASKDEKRAEKARAKEQRRAEKDAAKAQREAEQAMLDQETLGRLLGFRVFKDGTVEKEQPSGTAWLQTKVGQGGLLGRATNSCPRSPLVSATLVDKRRRRPFHRTRDVTAGVADVLVRTVSAGWAEGPGGETGEYHGAVTLTIITNQWTETLAKQAESEVAELLALNGLLQRAKNGPTSIVAALAEHPVPPPPPSTAAASPGPPAAPASTPEIDVGSALRELKGLHDEGLLTDDEYETRRQLLVAQLPVSAQLPTSVEAPIPAEVPIAAEVNAAAGWHPDPYGNARLRWWDGQAWSGHTAP